MCHILVAEDETKLAAFMVKGLKKQGFAATVVADGDAVLGEIQAHGYDVILLDLGLPIKDGWTVLAEIRQQGDRSPVIVVTAMGDLRQEALAAGANDYLAKPFRFRDLLEAVNRQLQPNPPSAA